MIISNKIKTILESINHPISKAILDLTKLSSNFINKIGYLDVALEDQGKISYVTVDRKDNFKIKRIKSLDDLEVGDWVHLHPSSEYYHQMHGEICQITDLTYLRNNDLHEYTIRLENESRDESNLYRLIDLLEFHEDCESLPINYFNKHQRKSFAYMTTGGKLVNKLFPKHFSPKDIETFSLMLFAKTDKLTQRGLRFRVVEGEDIAKYYHKNKYVTLAGTLGHSCMREKSPNFFDLYAKNGVQLLILVDHNDKVHGRALLWPNIRFDHLNESKYFMDRIYTVDQKDEETFKEYAENHDYVFKQYQSASDTMEFVYKNKRFSDIIYYDLSDIKIKLYPYVDTLRGIDGMNLNKISNNLEFCKYCTSMNNYETGEIKSQSKYVALYDKVIDSRKLYFSNYYEDYVLSSNAIEIQGDWYDKNIESEKGNLLLYSAFGRETYYIKGETKMTFIERYNQEVPNDRLTQVYLSNGQNIFLDQWDPDIIISGYLSKRILKSDENYFYSLNTGPMYKFDRYGKMYPSVKAELERIEKFKNLKFEVGKWYRCSCNKNLYRYKSHDDKYFVNDAVINFYDSFENGTKGYIERLQIDSLIEYFKPENVCPDSEIVFYLPKKENEVILKERKSRRKKLVLEEMEGRTVDLPF